jgi:hypothetical protein
LRGYEETCPLSQKQLIDEYFMEQRTKILDLAGFLDRMERSARKDAEDDFRYLAFKEALAVLTSAGGQRAQRVQMVLSDPTSELLEQRDSQGAFGAAARKEGRP